MVTITQMNFAKISIIAALIISTSAMAAASPAELTVFPEESSTRIDSFTEFEVTIENVGPVEDTYTFTSSSTSEIDIRPQKVNLEAGEEEEVNVWYNPSQDTGEGTYSFSITATSRATGDRYSSDITASVIRDHEVNLKVAQRTKTVCRGDTATYELEVTNDGIQKEEFDLSTDYGRLSQDKVTLEDGETKKVTLTASSDAETVENFNVRAASTTSYSQDIRNIQFNVETCYRSEMSVTPTEAEVAGGTEAEFDLTIRNTGTKEDEFTLSSNIGQFSENPVSVEGESSETVELSVETGQLGTKTVDIQAEGRSGSSTSVQLEAYNGNNMEVSFENPAVAACETDQATVETAIENTGETDEVFALETDRGALEQEEVEVDAGETETVETAVDAARLGPGTYELTTTATASTYGEPVKTATTEVNVENCWDVSVNAVPEVQSAGENSSVVYEVNVENTGEKGNTYELAHEGPEWISIKPKELSVGSGETETAYMYAGIPFQKEGNVQITATAVGKNATDSHTVELVVGKDIEESIKDNKDETGNSITGQFNKALKNIQDSNNVAKIALAVLLAAILTAAILVREW